MVKQGELFGECEHEFIEEIREQRGPHYGRRVCLNCRKFLGWVPHPDTLARQIRNAEILSELATKNGLNDWERQFIRTVTRHKHLSPRQQAQIELLNDKYLKGRAA